MKTIALNVDFQRRRSAAARLLGAVALFGALTGAVWVGERTWRESNALALAEARLERSTQRRTPLPAPGERRVTDADTLTAVARATVITQQLAVPWAELFEALEAADTRPLGLLGLTPNARDRSVRMTGEARTAPELLAYVERLAAQPSLAQVHLVGYSTGLRDGVPVLAFSLAASWRTPQ